MLREDVGLIENILDQLVKAMSALAQRVDNIQQTAVTENVIPPPASGHAQPHPVRIPVENPAMQEHHIFRDGCTSPHDGIEYHRFAFTMQNPQGASLMINIK